MSGAVPAGRLQLRKLPQQERSALRLVSILDAAASLLEEKDAAALTMSEVAVRAGIPIGSLYQFFPQKTALIKAVHDRVSAEMRGYAHNLFKGVKTLDEAVLRAQIALKDVYALLLQQPVIMATWNAMAADRDLAAIKSGYYENLTRVFYRDLVGLLPNVSYQIFATQMRLMLITSCEVIRYAAGGNSDQANAILNEWQSVVRRALFRF